MDENSPEFLFNKQQEKLLQSQPIPGVNQPQQNAQSIEEQRVLTQVQAGGGAPTPVVTSQGACRECGLIHPPLGPGLKCPNAPLNVNGEDGKPAINVNELVVKIKDILASQLEQKDIKDLKKFTGDMIMTLMKFCEEYKE